MCEKLLCVCLAVDSWPCVPALLSVDNIVLAAGGLWGPEGTKSSCIEPCVPLIETQRVPALQACLPAQSDMHTHCVLSYTAFLSTLVTSHELKSPYYFHPPVVLLPVRFMILTFGCFPWGQALWAYSHNSNLFKHCVNTGIQQDLYEKATVEVIQKKSHNLLFNKT